MRKKLITNAKSIPEVYFGMHFYPGVAEYAEAGKEPYRILLKEETIRKMNTTFPGRPFYVHHVDAVDLDNLEDELDGVVVRSFYNAPDGKTWVEFVAISDEAKQRIREGWGLSNAYFPKGNFGPGGLWNGVEYEKEILDGEFEHLALVPNPRYDEFRKILTRDQFKEYNESLESELKRLQNSNNDQKEKTMGLKLFKKTKVENSVDFESTMVELPLSKAQMSLVDLVAAHDKVLNMHGYAAGEHMVKVNESEEMSVNDMVGKYNEMSAKMKEAEAAKNEGMDEDESMENGDEADDKDREEEIESKKNDDEEQDLEYADKKSIGNKADKKVNEKEKKAAEKKEAGKKHFNTLKNAQHKTEEDAAPVYLMEDQVARGRDLYGSGK